MNDGIRQILWGQFGGAIDMVGNAIESCSDELWSDSSIGQPYWYLTFHTLFWLDYYLSEAPENFKPPEPFGVTEFDPSGLMPERIYTRDELRSYLEYGRAKCESTIRSLTDSSAMAARRFGRVEATFLELMLYNMRHVQHHAAQLNLLLRQSGNPVPRWVARANPSAL